MLKHRRAGWITIAILFLIPLGIVCNSPSTAEFLRDSKLTFGGVDMFEVDCFVRYLKMNGCESGSGGDFAFITIMAGCSESEYDKIVAKYKAEFGVDMNHKESNGCLTNLWPKNRIEYNPPQTVEVALKGLEPKSLLTAGIKQALHLNQLTKADRIEAYEYQLRPWISEDLKRTVQLQGRVWIAGSDKIAPFIFVPY